MPGPDATTPLAAHRLVGGRYRLDSPIARGGMAEVWAGHDEVLSRPVAVKVLLRHLADDTAVRERFRREAVTAARLAHPNVVGTFDTGIDGDLAYIVMELVPGGTLRDLLSERGPLPIGLAVSIGIQIADALDAAHRAGLVHRDIKPANVLVTEGDGSTLRVKVTDFGIAKAAEEAGGDLTVTGTVIGTPKYLSPEQVEGREPDSRADLYALGVVLFEMVTGRPPFEGATQMATALSHLRDDAPRLSTARPGVPVALDGIVAGLLAKDPAGRFASAAALRRALEAVPTSPSAATAPAWPRRDEPPTTLVGVRPPPPQPTARVTPPAPDPTPAWTSAGTRVPPAPGPLPEQPATSNLRRRRRRRPLGLLVVAVVAVGAALAAVLLTKAGRSGAPAVTTPPATSGQSPALREVAAQVVVAPGHSPDNAGEVSSLLSPSSGSGWSTAYYATPDFGHLYPGIGVAVEMSASEALHGLTVTSSTTGWTAQVYVGAEAPPSAGLTDPSSVYGAATAEATDTGSSTTLSLGGRQGRWVLLWLTSTGGPPYRVALTGLTVN